MIDVKNSVNQNISISVRKPQKVTVANATVKQSIDVGQQRLQTIDVNVPPSQGVEVKQDDITLNVHEAPVYTGEYKVTPKFTEQTLPTAQRILKEDMTVKEISVSKVTNTSGGNTVIIGE